MFSFLKHQKREKGLPAQAGQAMIIAVIFFICISTATILGLTNPMVRHIAMATSIASSKESFYAAEAGIEDVVYRLKSGLPVSPSQSLIVGNNNVVTTITDESGSKVVTAVGDANSYFRKVETRLTAGVGASFHYGLQTGTGGIVMSNNSIVHGNVYANGDISGSNGARITGSAYAANTSALNTDQLNDSPLPPTSTIQFGHNSTQEDVAQSFTVSQALPINKIAVYLRKVSTPGNLTVRITTDNGGKPSTNTLAQGAFSASLVTGSFGWIEIPLSSNPELVPSQTYWLVLDGSNNSGKYYIVGSNSDYPSGNAKIGKYGSTWNNTSPLGLDAYFKIFLGGLTSSINSVIVGSDSAGDARAHDVSGSTVFGALYCQSGSGNNKACDTSLPDPTPEPFPISDGNIEEWKSVAENSDGIINGNVSLSGSSSSLGPKKINGNFTLSNNYILNVTGTIWVTGDINISNGSVVKLSSSYGHDSGVIVSDGAINLSNNVAFAGSGQSGSYVLLLTTSSSANAINVSNNAGTVILNAQNGTINFANNAGAKSATAQQINLSNGATITYEGGLINVNFSSGPSGGYDILNWKEIE